MSDSFRVEPVARYQGARYPQVHPARLERAQEREKKSLGELLTLVGAALMAFWVATGLVACVDPLRVGDWDDQNRQTNTDSDTDGDYDIVAGGDAYCPPGELFCRDDDTLQKCTESGVEVIDCDTYCQENTSDPAAYGYSLGCDVTADDPCQCQYDMLLGDVAVCTPGDIICFDEQTLGVCEDYWHVGVDCTEYCQETLGDPEATSGGCDATDLADPCKCE